MIALAQSLGRPLPASTGEMVRVLTPVDAKGALPGSLSAAHGRGAFPFHTDTAFWPRPARYLIMRVIGDRRRPTKLLSFEQVWRRLDVAASSDVQQSVWRTRGGAVAFYCSMLLRTGPSYSWRYDAQTMVPANNAAIRAQLAMKAVVESSKDQVSVSWSGTDCLVVDNWRIMHARAAAPPGEGTRFLFRVYVE